MTDYISSKQFHESQGVAVWRGLGDGATAHFPNRSLAESAHFVQAIGELPGLDGHDPDLDVRSDRVTARLLTNTEACCGMTRRDVEVARQISATARKRGLSADPTAFPSLLHEPPPSRRPATR